MTRSPLTIAILFEIGLLVLALVLALLFGLQPWAELHSPGRSLVLAVLATAPLLLLVWLLFLLSPRWVRELHELTGRLVDMLFRNTPPGGILAVSLAAGFGEEFLFRGVLQTGLTGLWGPAAGLLLASLVFGLAHAVSRAYFLVATLIGLYLGLLYLWTGNLLVVCLVHALYDWVVIRRLLHRRRGATQP